MKKILFATLLFSCGLLSCKHLLNGDDNVTKGIALYEAEKFDEAISEYRIALDRNLKLYSKEEVYTYLGSAFLDTDVYDSAIFYYRKAVDLNPQYVEAWVSLGITHRLMNEYELAEENYKKAEAIDPNDPELLASMGALYVYTDDIDLGITYLKRAIAISPDMAIAHSNYAFALASNGDFENADKEMEIAIAKGYKNEVALRERIAELKAGKEDYQSTESTE